ncbi:ATP-dependent DNA helicase PIF4-like [Gossypium australe]|uniref:ATP-dependent DNA helicase n=1 Tax=Gossypium australe TaxID=47621 RepID=A0A5B6WT43_9ROSI|nr:ATP-dependent DNA helicase PIF4-like [Gossypium australe]
MIAIATATSGVAAAIMSGDRTTYSRFVLPLNPKDTALCVFSKQDGVCRIVKKTRYIIWDEAPMAKRAANTFVGASKSGRLQRMILVFQLTASVTVGTANSSPTFLPTTFMLFV